MVHPADLPAYLELAERCLRDGKLVPAEKAYRAALAENADLPNAWFNLAWTQRALRAFDDALASYGEAIARGVARPEEAHLNRATILSEHLGQTGAALCEIDAALSVNPDFIEGWLNLGSLREDLGKPEDARYAYQQVLRVDPGNGRAHGRMGMIEVFTADPGKAAVQLKDALSSARTVGDRAEILFALGTALDRQGLYDDAFQAFEAANWLARSNSTIRYDAIEQERLVDHLIDTFPLPAAAMPSTDGAPPLFIVGMFRSGSTLVEQIVGRHPAVTPGGELDFIPALVQSSLQPYPEAIRDRSIADLSRMRGEYADAVSRAGLQAGLITDKRCDNFLHIGLIKTLFPGAKIVNTVRQPLDNLLSIYFLHFGEGVAYGHDLRDAAHYYLQYRRLMRHWRRLFPDDIFDCDYDRMVADPRTTVDRLLRFLNLEWDEACLSSGAANPIRTASAWQVRQPLFTRSSGRWQNYAPHLEEIREMIEDEGVHHV